VKEVNFLIKILIEVCVEITANALTQPINVLRKSVISPKWKLNVINFN